MVDSPRLMAFLKQAVMPVLKIWMSAAVAWGQEPSACLLKQ